MAVFSSSVTLELWIIVIPFRLEMDVKVPSAGFIKEIIIADDKDKFVSFFNNQSGGFQPSPSSILQWICLSNAVNCATALLEGETVLTVNLNSPILDGYYPLHLAAMKLLPRLTELFLFYGARIDCPRCNDVMEDSTGLLPLNIALQAASYEGYLSGWNPETSCVHALILKLCMPEMNDALDTIKHLAQSTENLEMVAYHYAMAGKLIELAIMLRVAREKVLGPLTFQSTDGSSSKRRMTLFRCINEATASLTVEGFKLMQKPEDRELIQLHKKKMTVVRSTWLLLQIFRTAGGNIEDYLQLHPRDLLYDKFSEDLELMLRYKGFELPPIYGYDLFCGKKISIKEFVPLGCEIGLLQSKLPLQKTKNVPCIANRGFIMPKPPSQFGTQCLFSGQRLIHTNRYSKAISGSQCSEIVDVLVTKRSKAGERRVPKFLSNENWAYIATAIRRGIRRV